MSIIPLFLFFFLFSNLICSSIGRTALVHCLIHSLTRTTYPSIPCPSIRLRTSTRAMRPEGHLRRAQRWRMSAQGADPLGTAEEWRRRAAVRMSGRRVTRYRRPRRHHLALPSSPAAVVSHGRARANQESCHVGPTRWRGAGGS